VSVQRLSQLFADYDAKMTPASAAELKVFRDRAKERDVPVEAVKELSRFYQLSNGVPCLDSLDIHRCEDILLFEWWEDGELWLGGRDMNVFRWTGGKYCIGDAANASYGSDSDFQTLVDLIEADLSSYR
jgi:hypothetical protein